MFGYSLDACGLLVRASVALATADYFHDFRDETRKHGLIASKSGPHRSVIRMCPPLCLSMDDVDQVADGFDASFATVQAQ